jgi:hypothetical protein
MGRPQLGLKAEQNWGRNTLTDFGRQLVSMIPVDLGPVWMLDRCHWKLYEFVVPTDFVCNLGVMFGVRCSWNPNWAQT